MINQKLVNKLHKAGLNDRQAAIVLGVISDIKQEWMGKTFLLTLQVILNVLIADFWDSDTEADVRDKASHLMLESLSLFEALDMEVVSWAEVAEYIEDTTGTSPQAEWLNQERQ